MNLFLASWRFSDVSADGPSADHGRFLVGSRYDVILFLHGGCSGLDFSLSNRILSNRLPPPS